MRDVDHKWLTQRRMYATRADSLERLIQRSAPTTGLRIACPAQYGDERIATELAQARLDSVDGLWLKRNLTSEDALAL